MIGRQALESLLEAERPSDLDTVRPNGATQTEVQAEGKDRVLEAIFRFGIPVRSHGQAAQGPP
jgi:chromosome condensin MukBEF MukE localization factor